MSKSSDEDTKTHTGSVGKSVVKALEKVIHFILEPQTQFYPTFYKLQAAIYTKAVFLVSNQKAHGDCKRYHDTFDHKKISGEVVLHLNVENSSTCP